MPAKNGNADIARQYRTKHPDMPTLKLARIMYKENNISFLNLENARLSLRYIEGKTTCGKKAKKVNESEFFKTEARPYNPYKLPESHQEKREAFKLPLVCNNILLISDLHIPYHDIDAVTIALDYGKAHNVNTIFINGDLIDFHGVSRFDKDPRKRSVKQEFEAAKQFLVSLREAFPTASIYWLKGNHDIRWEHFLEQKVREIWDGSIFLFRRKAGKLSITHGHHIFKGIFVPVSPARGAFLRAKQSVIVGHLHRGSFHPETDLDGNVIGCWSTGCLCELKPTYSPMVSNSQHGFAHILIESSGDFTVKNYQIINGKLH